MAKKTTKKTAVKAEPPESKPEPVFTARFDTQTAAAAAAENSRYALAGAQIVADGASAWAVSTDGKMLLAVEASEHEGRACFVAHRKVLGGAVRGVTIKRAAGGVEARDNRKRGTADFGRVGEDIEYPFPEFVKILPEMVPDTHRRITLNPEFIGRLKALTDRDEYGVTLFVPENPNKPVLATGKHGIAAVMSCTEGDEGATRERWAGFRKRLAAAISKAND